MWIECEVTDRQRGAEGSHVLMSQHASNCSSCGTTEARAGMSAIYDWEREPKGLTTSSSLSLSLTKTTLSFRWWDLSLRTGPLR